MNETLQEFVDSRGVRMRVDRGAGVIRGVKILGLTSRNGRTPVPDRVYEISENGSRARFAYRVDCDGLTYVRSSTGRIDRAVLRMAASLFCAANRVIKARLDGELLPTAVA